jgi:hypothetical protein
MVSQAERSPESRSAVGEHMWRDAETLHGFGDGVSGAHEVGDAKTGSYFDIHGTGFDFRLAIDVVRAEAGVTDIRQPD